jgi:hypothetical protein
MNQVVGAIQTTPATTGTSGETAFRGKPRSGRDSRASSIVVSMGSRCVWGKRPRIARTSSTYARLSDEIRVRRDDETVAGCSPESTRVLTETRRRQRRDGYLIRVGCTCEVLRARLLESVSRQQSEKEIFKAFRTHRQSRQNSRRPVLAVTSCVSRGLLGG